MMPAAQQVLCPRVSVALCTFNGESFLQTQLDSILAQTVLPGEIVIGDDGSSDGTQAILCGFQQRALALSVSVRIRRHPRNVGYVRNFAETLADCRAEIVLLSDQDDRWHPDRVARTLQRFDVQPSLLLLHSDACLINAHGVSLGMRLSQALVMHSVEIHCIHEGRALDVLLMRNTVTGATCAIRRSLLEMALPIGSGWIHDEWLAMVAAVFGQMDMLEDPTIDYRQHGRNQIGARRASLLQRMRRLELFNPQQWKYKRLRLQALLALLERGGRSIAPDQYPGHAALLWRMWYGRMAMYRYREVGWDWFGHDLPRLLVRSLSVWLRAEGRVRCLCAAWAGAWAGWRSAIN
ncbi:hypothetical protein XalbCFBP2523_08365 [Xanthomonas albilineans]|nr:hypothetical protein XalbCFBP2523_08365 [Xanthomonas albilineans]